MMRNPILDLSLMQVLRHDIAVALQQVHHVYTVGNLLRAWQNPGNHRAIEQLFDSRAQARHAVAVCSTWLGVNTQPMMPGETCWWSGDESWSVARRE